MKKHVTVLLAAFCSLTISANKTPWTQEYQKILLKKVGHELGTLDSYPSMEFPNQNYEEILKKYPDDKVLLFGYGSLMNYDSASRSISPLAVDTSRPVIAFGFKRLFNYKAANVSRWGTDLHEKEKAMLNIVPTTRFNSVINGVVMEVSQQDLAKLIQREIGYDLVPMLIADWKDVVSENPNVKIEIAYTFLVPDELRNGIDYTQTKYYPVRGYLKATREGANTFGPEFLNFWNATTYLGDGTTNVNQWNEQTFSGILDTREP